MLTNKHYGVSLLDENDEHIFFSNDIFYLKHGTEYKILITNQSKCRANAHIFVDGKELGSFRIESNGKIVIERPENDNKKRKLTFFDISSKEAKMGRIEESSEIGKLVVKIEKEKIPAQFENPTSGTRRVQHFNHVEIDSIGVDHVDGDSSVGGTALGRFSNQRFVHAPYMLIEKNVIFLEASMLLEDAKIIPL